MKVRARAVFRGRVQGVFFRANCEEEAARLGLSGYVRNLPDGGVEAVFEGEKEVIERAIEWNRTSQPYARVSDVKVEWGEATGESDGFSRR